MRPHTHHGMSLSPPMSRVRGPKPGPTLTFPESQGLPLPVIRRQPTANSTLQRARDLSAPTSSQSPTSTPHESGIDSLSLAKALTDSRLSPGVLVLNLSLKLLYMNAEARELTGAMNQSLNGRKASGVLPPEITRFCEELLRLMQVRTGPKDWEQTQLRRVTGNAKCFVLLRGFGLPAMAGVHEAHVIVTMEEISGRREVTAERARERFHLTDREQTVIIYLLKGLTNKEIACRLMITEQTVKEHLKHIMHKTHASTRTGVLAEVLLAPARIPLVVRSEAERIEALEQE